MSENIWPTIHAERAALADDLAGLRDDQWQTPSLCTDWTVHDVLAHLLSAAKMTPPQFVGKFAGAGFVFDRFAARQVALEGAGGPAATLRRVPRGGTAPARRPGPRTPGSARRSSTARTSAGRWASSTTTRCRRSPARSRSTPRATRSSAAATGSPA